MNSNRSSQHNNYPTHAPTEAIGPGRRGPDFCLRSTPDQSVKLSELQGRTVILAFYPADWSPVCSDEMSFFNECLPEFQRFGAELLGISVDGVWCHTAFAKDRKLHFPLLSDFEPKGATAAAYGVYRHNEGVTERALFVLDRNGIVHWSYISPIGISPGADGILNALEDLQEKKEAGDAAGKAEAPATKQEQLHNIPDPGQKREEAHV